METKGEHLKNDDSRQKIDLGAAWSNYAESQFQYYIVFKEKSDLPKSASQHEQVSRDHKGAVIAQVYTDSGSRSNSAAFFFE